MTDKVRAARQGNFPILYRLSLGSRIGIDGYFLRHFELSFREFRNAVIETLDDKNLEQWFLNQPGGNASRIANWNEYGPQLGTPGFPGATLRPIIQWVVYPKLYKQPIHSLFEMIEQDEAL